MGADDVVAIVLAAGRSSRMGDFKPLLPFGGRTLIEHMTAGFREAGVRRIHVVTGYRAEALAPELQRLGLTEVHNGQFDRGMFSSVQTGIASLPADARACLIVPVDAPLVRVSTLARILAAAAESAAAVVYPNYRGGRGHPPLIRRELFAEVLAGDGEGGLQGLLARHQDEALDVDVFDWGCLVDIDRPEDYRRILQELRVIGCPTTRNATRCWRRRRRRRRCAAIAAPSPRLATSLARRLWDAGEPVDPALVRAAAWVHDIAKGQPRHAAAGAEMVSAFGFPELAPTVARHMDAPDDAMRLDERRRRLPRRQAHPGRARGFAGGAFRSGARPLSPTTLRALAGARRRFAAALAVRDAIEARIGSLHAAGAPSPGAAP